MIAFSSIAGLATLLMLSVAGADSLPAASYVAPGSFVMGGNVEDFQPHAEPLHRVTLTRPFLLDRTVVTVADFADFARDADYATDAESANRRGESTELIWWRAPGYVQADDWPVTCVTFRDAVRYANWRSRRDGLAPAYRFAGEQVRWDRFADGYRLPTEAEWEFAARCGGACSVPPVEDPDGIGPVREFLFNELGLFGMHDGVLEWCWDGFHPYGDAPAVDPVGIDLENRRVVRGLGTFRREWASEAFYSGTVGFRLARDASAMADSADGSHAALLDLLAEQDAIGHTARRLYAEGALADSLLFDHRSRREKTQSIAAGIAGAGLVTALIGAGIVESSRTDGDDATEPKPTRVRTGETMVLIGVAVGLVGSVLFSRADRAMTREEALERARSILAEPDLASGDRALGVALRW